MNKAYKHFFWYLTFVIAYGIAILTLVFLTGCAQPLQTDNSTLESWIEIAQAFSIANAASAPVNPFVLPIGVGLAGLTAILEALRRQEKSGRKHAESVINNGNNNK